MDSGNSGSMQSSSTAGDEEYDSRAESSSLSAFLSNTNNNSNPVPPPQQHTTTTTTTLTQVGPFTHVFNPLSNYMDPTQRTPSSNQNQILNLDMVWSKVAAARSEPDLSRAGLIPCSSSSFSHNNTNNNHQAFLSSQLGPSQSQTQVNVGVGVFPTTLVSENGGNVGSSREPTSTNANVNAARNPKKRSRASRRAPTTVLTTDTTNFRAMVQEFTGIPAPPFTSSPFPRTRLDLFTSSSPIMRSSTHLPNGTLDPPTSTTPAPYLLRPFAHKVQSQPSIPPMLDILASHHNNSSTNNNFHNPLNMHNPILSLQSMLQPPPKYQQQPQQQQQQQAALEIAPSGVDSSHLRMGGLEELGLTHAHVSGHHHNMVQSSSDGALSRVNNNNNNLPNNSISGPSSAEWAQAQAQRIDHNDGGVLMSLNYRSNVPDQRVSNAKVNFSSGGASDFHGDKGPECGVAARSEGMVESWINCSSD